MNKLSLTRLVIGALIILVGVSLLLDSVGLTIVGDVLSKLWPAAIIVLGLVMLVNNKNNYLWSLVVLAVGNILLLNTLELLEINAWKMVWPVLVIVIGISIITKRAESLDSDGDAKKLSKDGSDSVVAILSGSEQKIHSDDFSSSKITAVMGGVVYDLRKAVIKKDATIEVFSLWGGVELIVPESVEVRCTTKNLLGGIENRSVKPTGKGAPVLRVVGDVVMAGIEIKN